jgi:uncharacterized membrane protein HdeD (DUF308 family)
VTDHVKTGVPQRHRAGLITAAGIAIILLSAGSAVLPAADQMKGSTSVGTLLLVAGAIELFAGSLRRQVKPFAMAAGAVTCLAGALFLLNPTVRFFPTVSLIIAWLLFRSFILIVASSKAGGSVRIWTGISAGMDFLLAVLLFAGLSIATLVVSLFGPTQPLIASFAWVLAGSFVVTGTLLLEVASCERDAQTDFSLHDTP